MRSGAFATLAEVVDFYDAGGGSGNTVLEPLALTDEEKADLVAFLEALSMDAPLTMEAPELPETATNGHLGGVPGMNKIETAARSAQPKRPCMNRRDFLVLGGTAVTVLATFGEGAFAQQLVTSSYTRKVIGKVSELEDAGVAVPFTYPTDDIENLLVMLDEEAGAGVGEDRNIVAFNTVCPHMGGYMDASLFRPDHSVLGPCPLHLSTFDLTVRNPNQPRHLGRDHLIETLIERVDSGGMVLVNSDIYPVEPLNTQYADIVLPAAGWGEVDFTRCNAERRLRLYAKFNDAPGEAKPDWWAIARFAQKMGFKGFDWTESNDIFEEAARFSRGGVLNYYALAVHAKREGKKAHEKLRELGTTGIQTPIRVIGGELVGTPKLHDPGNDWGELEDVTTDQKWLYAFGTHTGKANLLKTPWNNDSWSDFYEAIKPRPEKGEIWITNGRVNEVWQSGFDDLRKPELAKRWPWPHIVIHPEDAAPQGIESGDLVEGFNDTVYVQTGEPVGAGSKDLSFSELLKNGHIKTTTGQFVAVAIVSDEMRSGVAKAAFSYPGSMANAVCHAVPDPVSGNYRYKLGRGVLRKVGESAYKRNFLAMSLKPRPIV